MQIKNITIVTFLLLAMVVLAYASTFTATVTITDLPQGQSVVYYLKSLNASILGTAETITPQTPPQTYTPTNSILLPSTYLSATCIDKILSAKGSPAAGTGSTFVSSAQKYGVDPAFVLAIFNAESNYATNPAATTALATKNIGHILCTDSEKGDTSKCYYKKVDGVDYYYKIYSTWSAGVEATFSHLKNSSHYIAAGRTTVESVSSMWVTGKDYSSLSGTQKTEIDKYISTVKSSMENYTKSC